MTRRLDASTGVLLILVASLCFGVCGPLAKSLIREGLTPLQVTWLRVAGVCVAITITLTVGRRPTTRGRRRTPVRRLPWAGLIAYGLTAIAGVQACYFLAVSRLPVGIALLLEFTGPILVVAWIRVVRRTRLPRAAVVGALLSLAGLAVVVQIWTGLRLDALGLAAGAAAAACQAAYYLGGERLMADLDVRIMLAIGFAVGTVGLALPATPWDLDWGALLRPAALGDFSMPGLVVVLALIGCTAVAYATGLPALRRLSAPVAGAMGYAEVVVAAVAAWLLVGEEMTVPQIVGGVIVIAGVFTAQRAVAVGAGTTDEVGAVRTGR